MELLDIRNISSSWGIEVKDIKVLSERATLIITGDKKKFILKKKGSAKQFESELKLLNHLKDCMFSTHVPLFNLAGDFIVSYQNANYCIYNYLDGETFSAVESLQDPLAPKLLGQTIANLNKAMNSINFSNEFPNKDLYKMVYGFAVNEIVQVDNSKRLIKIYEELEKDLKIIVSSLPKQLIHRDAHIHNIIYKESMLRGVIDFEIAEVNTNIFDICYCSTSVLSEVFSTEKHREKWIAFVGDLIAGYNQSKLLLANELKSIWSVMLCIQTIFMSYFSSNKDIYEINKAMFLWIYENRSKIENKILLGI